MVRRTAAAARAQSWTTWGTPGIAAGRCGRALSLLLCCNPVVWGNTFSLWTSNLLQVVYTYCELPPAHFRLTSRRTGLREQNLGARAQPHRLGPREQSVYAGELRSSCTARGGGSLRPQGAACSTPAGRPQPGRLELGPDPRCHLLLVQAGRHRVSLSLRSGPALGDPTDALGSRLWASMLRYKQFGMVTVCGRC